MTKLTRQDNPLFDCSLVSLRAFREVAKHKNFTQAAVALTVTQSAVSHRIKTLEQQLEVKLFYRRGREYELTSEGRTLFLAIDKAFDAMEEAIGRIHPRHARQRVTLGVLSSFATKWLLPRLGGFYRDHPNIELVVRSVNHTIDVEREQLDIAVINLPSPLVSKKVESIRLWRERLFAICSPHYLNVEGKSPQKIDDLKKSVLLHDETEIAAERGFDWSAWLAHFKREEILYHASSQYFSQSDLMLQAAIAGHGVALTRTSIAATDIKNGLLINPFPKSDIATQSACYLCGLKSSWEEKKITTLRDWLLAEAAGRKAGDS